MFLINGTTLLFTSLKWGKIKRIKKIFSIKDSPIKNITKACLTLLLQNDSTFTKWIYFHSHKKDASHGASFITQYIKHKKKSFHSHKSIKHWYNKLELISTFINESYKYISVVTCI